MKLYRISHQSVHAPREWVGTQDEAKKRSKELGGFFDHVEVPVDKPGLLGWLNENARFPTGSPEDAQPAEEVDELYEAEQRAIAAASAKVDAAWEANRDTKVAQMWTATDIEDFLLNRASVDQVERVFATLGTRFKELVNAAA